jgi:hypothetical protein
MGGYMEHLEFTHQNEQREMNECKGKLSGWAAVSCLYSIYLGSKRKEGESNSEELLTLRSRPGFLLGVGFQQSIKGSSSIWPPDIEAPSPNSLVWRELFNPYIRVSE